ncbi:Uncharacterised protein [Mycobacteroides abscessus subsp. abscessus]|nr:Uncharacterised protein [Mycobacteroides abscessus subsp. abscessus]
MAARLMKLRFVPIGALLCTNSSGVIFAVMVRMRSGTRR